MLRMVALTLGLFTCFAALPIATAARQAAPPTGSAIETLAVRPNVHLIAGAGGNVVAHIGDDGVFLIDAGAAGSADAILRTLRTLTDKPIRYIINTSADPDHVGGNEVLSKAGRSIWQVVNSLSAAMTNNGAAGIIAFETVLFRMSGREPGAPAFPTGAWPTDSHAQPRRTLRLNDDAVELLHQPAAHSDGDMMVFFRQSDVIVAGDIIDTEGFPRIDVARGGSIQGEIAALNRIVELAVPQLPFYWKAGGTYIVPGHGRVYTPIDVVAYRDMVTIIRDRVEDLVKQGMTLQQVQAAAPAQGFTAAFGSDTGPWTTNMFIEAIFRGMNVGTR